MTRMRGFWIAVLLAGTVLAAYGLRINLALSDAYMQSHIEEVMEGENVTVRDIQTPEFVERARASRLINELIVFGWVCLAGFSGWRLFALRPR